MNSQNDLLNENIMHDMSSALAILDTKGSVRYLNPAAEELLGVSFSEAGGIPFVKRFLGCEENDRFVQLILDAVYEKNSVHEGIVPFRDRDRNRTLRVKTSYLYEEGRCIGIICLMDDITELYELRDAVKAMEEIRRLNKSLTLRNTLLKETFGRYLSDEIVTQLLETKDGLKLGGKKQELTVLMSDLRGFTALSEQMKPDDLIRMLNHYLAEMTGMIQEMKGTIIEFIGDGIMAVFGAPVFYADHALRAVAAACRMQNAMEDVNRWNRTEGYPELEMGIGVHTGEVIIGNIGSEQRTKYGATGRNVNLAGRIESFTSGGEILVSEMTLKKAGPSAEAGNEKIIYPKGAEEPLRIYEVTGTKEPYPVQRTLPEREELAVPPEKVSVGFVKLSEKMKESEEKTGVILAVSGREMILGTDADLRPDDNLCLAAGGDLYAKVKEKDGTRYRLRFTSKPPEFSAWLTKLLP